MAQHLHFYMNNPTADGVDGTEISNNIDTLPLNIILDASQSETKIAKCAIRCDSGYEIEGDATLYFEGTNADKWSIAPGDNYSDTDTVIADALFSSVIILADVKATNKIFWVKATSSETENPKNDRSVKIVAEGLVVASESD